MAIAHASIQVVIMTNEDPEKVSAMVATLASEIGPGDSLGIASGAPQKIDLGQFGPAVSIWHFADETIFHLRARIPSFADGRDWFVLLEDHNAVPPGWFAAVRSVLSAMPPTCPAVIGAVDNRTSTSAWSWASFLHTFAFHWAPTVASDCGMTINNLAFRQRVLDMQDYPFGQFEVVAMQKFEPLAARSGDFPVDHIQHYDFRGASAAHWHIGTMAGWPARR